MDPTCNRCDGPLVLLGVLGHLEWLRCRDCGAECHRDASEETFRIPDAALDPEPDDE